MLNALTLWSFIQPRFDGNAKDPGSAILIFFQNIGKVAESNHQQAIVLSGMLFTFVIWVFGALSLLLSVLFYVLFLWHYIPNADGGLSGYCERKINRRLANIVSVKVDKALREEDQKRAKADAKAAKKGEKPVGRQATLPTFGDSGGDKLPAMPMLNRNDTTTTLPLYSSRPGTPSGQPPMPGLELNLLDQKRPLPSRNMTGMSAASNTSFASNAPLMGNASDMGYGRSASPAPSLRQLENGFPAPQRTMTSNSYGQGPPRMPSAMGDRGYTASPVSYDNQSPPAPYGNSPPIDPYGRPMPRAVDDLRSNTPSGPAPSMGPRMPFNDHGRIGSQGSIDSYGRASPAPTSGGYAPYNPSARSASPAPGSQNYPAAAPQYRNMTDPGQQGDYFNTSLPVSRPATAQNGPRGVGGSVGVSNGISNGISRLASPAPYNQGGSQSPNFGGAGANGYRR